MAAAQGVGDASGANHSALIRAIFAVTRLATRLVQAFAAKIFSRAKIACERAKTRTRAPKKAMRAIFQRGECVAKDCVQMPIARALPRFCYLFVGKRAAEKAFAAAIPRRQRRSSGQAVRKRAYTQN